MRLAPIVRLAALCRLALPSPTLISLLAAIGALFLAPAFDPTAAITARPVAWGLGLVLAGLVGLDAHLSLRDWRGAPLAMQRHLPHAFALGAPVTLKISIDNPGRFRRRGRYFELADPTLDAAAMPLRFTIPAGARQTLEFRVTPTARGLKSFAGGQILLRSVLGLLDWNRCIGGPEVRRVYPDFRRQAAFAWMAANRRPISRSFRDDRDQSVMFLLDCGRRMRADDAQLGAGASHFDQSLDALMLLAFVALARGDAVGAVTFGSPPGGEKRFAPRKGRQALNALMAELGDVQPTATYSDYPAAAADLLRRQRKRGLLVVITNCRDEDSAELASAVRLLRSRHLVVVANLREPVVARLALQPLSGPLAVLEVAAAVEYEQRRRDMQRRVGVQGGLLIDCEPRALGVELVKRYDLLKRTGAI